MPNQYRQRAEQVPPLVETLRKKAPPEREVLCEVMAAVMKRGLS